MNRRGISFPFCVIAFLLVLVFFQIHYAEQKRPFDSMRTMERKDSSFFSTFTETNASALAVASIKSIQKRVQFFVTPSKSDKFSQTNAHVFTTEELLAPENKKSNEQEQRVVVNATTALPKQSPVVNATARPIRATVGKVTPPTQANRTAGIVGMDSITLWIMPDAVVNQSNLVVSYTVNNPVTHHPGGLIHIPQFRIRRCVNVTSTGTNLPQCPRAGPTKMPLFAHEKDVEKHLLLTIFDSNAKNAMSTRKELSHVTYWDGAKDVLVSYTQWKVQVCGATPFCSKKLYRECPPNTPGFLYFVDNFDSGCKPLIARTRMPIQPWFGPCSCETTCLTEFNQNSMFPYSSKQEIAEYGKAHAHEHVNYPLHETGLAMEHNYSSACDALKQKANLTHSKYIPASFSHHLFFIPQLKLIFCGVPKVGMTEWLKFFRYVIGAQDYLGMSHFKHDLKQFAMRRLSREKASQLWMDPEWTKAVFIRNPAERLLSAYLDKIAGGSATQTTFKMGDLDPNAPKKDRLILNFPDFVDLITNKNFTTPARGEKHDPKGLHRMTDPHWKPQLWTCGMDEVFPLLDFVGNFKHISSQTKLLLEKVGGWDKWGATYDTLPGNRTRKSICHTAPRIDPPVEDRPGLNQKGRGDETYKHSTGADSRLTEYYTKPSLLKKVREAYAMDYAVWDEIKDRAPDDVASARDLEYVKKECELS